MAHRYELEFVRTAVIHLKDDWEGIRVLEIGSYNVAGSIRSLFAGTHYTGVDLVPGPGVDVVGAGDTLDWPSDIVDFTISCECFEHNAEWVSTFRNMCRMTRPGGAIIVTCASTGRFEHGTPRTSPECSPGTSSFGMTYYRNITIKEFLSKLEIKKRFSEYFIFYNKYGFDLYFAGLKIGEPKGFRLDPELLQTEYLRVMDRLHEDEMSKYPYPRYIRSISAMTRAPLWMVPALPDSLQQGFNFYYLKYLDTFKRRLGRFVSRRGR